ncbi:Uncharacterised protein [Serratia fonticola]|uniref:Trypsin-like peptidase n=1 Tax=Serratia fonticola TaxID=47917 RepID=A0A3S4WS06_SERFO|nr:Uncharacterised protein [Serratia fonticola]
MNPYQVNNLYKVTAFVYISNSFIGCAVIFKNNEKIMLATAFHVLSTIADDFKNKKHLIQIKDENNRLFTVNELKGNITECEERDIALLILNGEINGLEEVFFLNPLNDPSQELVSRCRSKNIEEPKSIYSKEQSERCNDFFYYITVDKGLLGDSTGYWGASALEGISGAGVFIKTHQQLVLTGIISAIPDEGMLGKIKCCNASSFIEMHDSLKTQSDIHYNFRSSVIKESVAIMKIEHFDSVINDWEINEENKEYNKNIDRKIKTLHINEKIKNEKRKILHNLISGNNYANERLINSPNIELGYSNAHQIFCGEDMTVYVGSRIEASRRYTEIRERYLEVLSDSLHSLGLRRDEILLLRNKDIAFWLANCDLDFLEDDHD